MTQKGTIDVPTIITNGSNKLVELQALYQREIPDPSSSLGLAARYHFKNPGKSFRAQLALSTGFSLGLNPLDNLHWAAACELLHNASLIHDDISDASTHRRGQESIHLHFGPDMALCLGDWMVAKAFELGARNTHHSGGALVALLAQAMQRDLQRPDSRHQPARVRRLSTSGSDIAKGKDRTPY